MSSNLNQAEIFNLAFEKKLNENKDVLPMAILFELMIMYLDFIDMGKTIEKEIFFNDGSSATINLM